MTLCRLSAKAMLPSVRSLAVSRATGFVSAGAAGGTGARWQIFASQDFTGELLRARFASLDAIGKAVHIARERNMPAERIDELRNLAIACLALPDWRTLREWEASVKELWERPLPPNFKPTGRRWKREELYERGGKPLA